MNSPEAITVIGGGLAGCEAAWQLLKRGFHVKLFEMRPIVFSPAHKTPHLAELVCSNSLGSKVPEQAPGILKDEMRLAGSLIIEAADKTSVPAGRALAVDRNEFSGYIEERLASCRGLEIIREEVAALPDLEITIVATGPLTADSLAEGIAGLTGGENLYFYDAISPIVEGDSLDFERIFRASRYEEAEGDYLNCPLNKEEYEAFWQSLIDAEKTPLRAFEDPRYFEACLPVEELAARGFKTLAFGPMKPVGLVDPKTGKKPYAVVQLRKEDREGRLYNLVGFQTKMTRGEQERIFRTIPGLNRARFARLGSIHRNTFISSPNLLGDNLQLTKKENIFFAGQLTGVEGYVESAAMGLLAGISAGRYVSGEIFLPPPRETALGSLLHYLTSYRGGNFQPMNINLGLFPPVPPGISPKEKGAFIAKRSKEALEAWIYALDPLSGSARGT